MAIRILKTSWSGLCPKQWQLSAAAMVATTLLSACASTPYNIPIRIPVDGGRGFSMQGSVKFTRDPDVTKQRVQRWFDRAC